MLAPQTNPARESGFYVSNTKRNSYLLFDSGDVYHCPALCIPVYRFFFPVAIVASFGDAGLCLHRHGWVIDHSNYTNKAVLEGRGFYPHFLMILASRNCCRVSAATRMQILMPRARMNQQ